MAELTPMMQQYKEIKKDYEDYILFYRLGDFYEMFFDDAVKASKALGIALTRRNAGGGTSAPLCGVPFHAADSYLAKLVSAGYKVAICDQLEDPKEAKGLVSRGVTKLITPGTITDPDMIKETSNAYLASVSETDESYALAYADISTGLLKLRVFDRLDQGGVLDAIYVLEAKEILASEAYSIYEDLQQFTKAVNFDAVITKKQRAQSSHSFSLQHVRAFFSVASLEGYGVDENDKASIDALSSLIEYIELTQKTKMQNIEKISVDYPMSYMHLDAFTVQNLELTQSMTSGESAGSLLGVLDKTKTAMGARLLKQWVLSPLLNEENILSRQNACSYLKDEILIRSQLREMLGEIYDFERLMTKCVLGSLNPRDALALRASFSVLPVIGELISDFAKLSEFDNADALNDLYSIAENYDAMEDLYKEMLAAISDDPPATLRGGEFIKANYNSDLDELKDLISNANERILEIESAEKQRTGIKTLKIGFNKVFGYYIEVSKGQLENVPEDYIRKQTLVNSERYILPRLKDLEDKILGAKDKAQALEFELFSKLRERILAASHRINIMSEKIAHLDVLCSFAQIAESNAYVRPQISVDRTIEIKDGRHPVVESISTRGDFVPNDALLDEKNGISLIITGPNMAGKSTFLRQVALICLMAQMGSFVPASSAIIGISDRIFTRVGASDDLYRGKSTFMVEMLELAGILNHATDRSLIILDEIGRGTATYDGLSLAWSAEEYIATRLKSRSLFATHYHEMTELESIVPGIANYRIAAVEKNDEIIFLRKLERGSASKSFGVQVAKLAGVPSEVINRARHILRQLESSDIVKKNNIQGSIEDTKQAETKIDDKKKSESLHLLSEIYDLNIETLSPIDALLKLEELKSRAVKILET